MMAGEKKWTTSRRSGMTVLGKVAVPKPLNFPSQKLENHGLNPSVEIVPKGTLGWGSQSSSVPNAWGSSPKANGSTGSPSHLSGRPSSGSGTRPSTGGNDRTLDPTSNVWGPTSRPSSASGALTSNQTAVTTLRQHSAETRSGSSQLSQFAEPLVDNSLGWGPNGASSNLRGRPSNSDGFSLSSGAFPSLGSEKDGSGKNIDSQEYGHNSRPGSSSGKATSVKENTSFVGNAKGETVNTWTREYSQHNEHGVQPTAERWHGEFPHGGNPHRPLQHFDAWHGPPMNHLPAGWYGGGPPRGPPFGPPLQPGGFPMEPFPYYRPHFPQQQVPHRAASRGHHPKNGELCRSHVPEGYIHSRMPMNPGFYPPPVAYEGFYGPPMGYCNPNERDMPFMGTPHGPPVYKRHPYENADPHPRSPAYGSRGKPSTAERAPKTGHSDDTRGPYKVLLKQSTDRDEKRADGEWDRGVPSNIPSIKKKDHLREPLQKNEWGLEDDQGTYPSYSTKFPENTGSTNAVADYLGNKPGEESSFSQLPQVVSASPRSSTFMHDAKPCNIDGPPPDVAAHPFRENRYNQPHTSGGPSRRNSHDAQSRVDYHGKRLNNYDVDGLRSKLHAGESSAEVSVTNLEASANVLVRHHPNILVESGNSDINLQDKNEAGYSTQSVDDSDSFAQRATMREIAKQRSEKLQKEDEERTREQKAKALAKLEELNRRSHIADSSNQKLENSVPRKTAEQEEENSQKSAELNTDFRSETSSSAIVYNREDQIRDSTSIMVGENTVVYKAPILVPVKVCPNTELINNEFAFQVRDEIVTKNKRTEYKQRQSVNSAKDVIEKSIPSTETGTPNFKAASDGARPANIAIAVSSSGEPCLVTNSLVMTDSSTHHKRKNNCSSTTKHKADVVIPASVVPSTVAKEDYAAKDSTETCELDANVPQSKAAAKHSTQVLEQHSSLTEETIGKGNHQVKIQQSRHMPRNQQANNRMAEIEKAHSSETVTWAPVRSQNKIELTDKPGDKADPRIGSSNVKVASVMQNNMKHKRAEMERYVPKPVAKDLAQQVSIQQLAATQSIKGTQPGDSVIADAGRGAVLKNGDIKRNHSSNARGMWNQRVYVESALNHGLQEAGKKPIEQNQLTKSDIISSKLQTTDGWNSNDISDTLVTKGRGVPGRGKQHPFKGDRSTGNTFELDCGTTVEASSESAPTCGMNQIDNKNGSGENRFIGERTPQWKPKTQVYAVHNYQNRTSERQMNNPASETRAGQYHSEPVNVENVAHQDFDRTRNPMSSRVRPRMPYEIPANNRVQSEIVYGKNDQQFPSGVRKYGNHNNRSGRGHEPHGDAAFNRERPRHTSHFEYQPVGQYGINKPNKSEDGVTEGSNNAGPIYRERNHSHPRRGGGNLYGRQSGGSHGDPSYY